MYLNHPPPKAKRLLENLTLLANVEGFICSNKYFYVNFT